MTSHPAMTVLGLDVSLRSTGWAVLAYEDGALVDCGLIVTAAVAGLARNLRHIERGVRRLGEHADVGIEEGISYRNGGTTRALAWAWAAAVLGSRVDPHIVPIAAAKRLGTGRGNASKDEMVSAAVARWGDRANQSDIADACWIAEATRLHLIKETERTTTP